MALGLAPLTVVAPVTAAANLAAGTHVPVNATSGALVMTLPTPTRVGQRLRVEKIDSSQNVVTITGTIRGASATVGLRWQFHSLEFVAESTSSWRPASGHITAGSLDGAYLPRWAPNTVYAADQIVLSPTGQIVKANTGFTSGATYSPGNWTIVAGAAPRTTWAAEDHGLVTWAFDPSAVNASTNIGSGVLYMIRMHVPVAATITNLILYLTSAGSGLTAGQSFAALYDSALALRGQTADQSTNWTSTQLKSMPLTSPVAVTPGDYYLGFYSVGTTRPNFSRGNDSSLSNIGLSGGSARYATSSTGLTTAPPSTAGALSAINPSLWGAMS